MMNMQVKEVMTPRPEVVSPDATLEQACVKMKDVDCGVLPVGTLDNIEGVITDRDIIVRAIAAGVDPGIAIVRDYMTPEIHTCKSEETLQDAADAMNRHNVSRLLVQDSGGTVVGILTFGHAMRSDKADNKDASEMMCRAIGRA